MKRTVGVIFIIVVMHLTLTGVSLGTCRYGVFARLGAPADLDQISCLLFWVLGLPGFLLLLVLDRFLPDAPGLIAIPGVVLSSLFYAIALYVVVRRRRGRRHQQSWPAPTDSTRPPSRR
jgi:hypothetical protein